MFQSARPCAPTAAVSRSTCTPRRWAGGLQRASLGGQGAAAASPAAPERRRRKAASPTQAASTPAPAAATQAAAPTTLLWYKRDLRLDDHPGWHQALSAGEGAAVPVFILDPARYAPLLLAPGGAEALLRVLASLNRSLRARGSALLVRLGAWEEQLPALAAELGAAAVVGEQEVEAEWCDGVAAVAAALGPRVALRQWQAPLCASHADDYRELQQQQPSFLPPLEPPAQLPPLPAAAVDAVGSSDASGSSSVLRQLGVSSAADLRQQTAVSYTSSLHPQLLPAAQALGLAGGGSGQTQASSSASASFSEEEGSSGRLIDRVPVPAEGGAAASNSSAASWEAELAAEIATGEGPVLEALGRYLRHLETDAAGGSATASSDADSLAAAIAAFDAPATPDGCFPALFGRALSLGVVSQRRIWAEATSVLQQAPEQAPPQGLNPLALLSWLLTSSGGAAAVAKRQRKAAAAAAAVQARDFHAQMAAGRQGRQAHGAALHHWRWRGLLTDYLVARGVPPAGAGATASAERPAILLCHGFGAFSEHYRGNVAALAAAGYDVYAPTLPGYGRSEKPVLPYGQDLWRDFLASFVLEVVRRPVVVAGNSIGGFISASMAADYPGLVQGLILLNSAGQIVEGYQPPLAPPPSSPPPPFVVNAVSQALFSFLEGDVTNQLRRVYPVRPARADAWLGGEIGRAARDPGALGVFRSVFYLPKPRALNYLVAERFGGPTLVLQGTKDPLNNAPARADDLGRCCPNVQVVKLDAGHCPHDEVPDAVNAAILGFIEQSVLPSAAAAAAGTGSGGAPRGMGART